MSKLYIISGPERGRQSDLGKETTTVGRSPENDIQVRDNFVSRRHLKITRRDEKHFLTDLDSKNGTIIDGKQISPGIETEVPEGLPIVIGMSVICLGEACEKYLKVSPEPIDMAREVYQDGMVLVEDRPMTGKKNRELLARVSEALIQANSLDDTLEKVADYIFEILKRIDRVVIILIDPETGVFSKVVSRTAIDVPQEVTRYNRDVVERVIRHKESFVVNDAGAREKADLSQTLNLLNIGSVMCIPLIGKESVRGVIYMDSLKKAHGFRKEDLSLFTALSRRTATAIENALAGHLGDFVVSDAESGETAKG